MQPQLDRLPHLPAQRPTTPRHGVDAPRQILVAEDDDAARVMVQRYLEGKGYAVTAVTHGQAVIDALTQKTYDLLILDVMMPVFNGFDVLVNLREQGDSLPVIMVTAVSSPDDIVRGLELGADDYVTKPYSFSVLQARIELRLRLRAAPPVLRAVMPSPTSPPPAPEETFEIEDEILSSAPAVEEGFRARLSKLTSMFSRPSPSLPELRVGSRIADRYVVEEKIGAGGFGVVFRARHLDIGQSVAIKVLHPGARPGSFAAFRQEAQNASRVRHPHAVRVYDFGALPDATAYLVMELLEGPNLEDVLVPGEPMEVSRAASILRPVLTALSAAHKQGLVHRDVKPGNVVLHREDEREVPKLLDFGIAKEIDPESGDGGSIVGSLSYVAPERLRGTPYDGRSDVYSCGVVLYRLLTGSLPFDFDPTELQRVALWHVREKAPPPSTKNPALSRDVDELVARMLAKEPSTRPNAADAASLVEAMAWD